MTPLWVAGGLVAAVVLIWPGLVIAARDRLHDALARRRRKSSS